MTASLTIKAPGKLMVAGEFAVLEPYQKLAVMAVDRFAYATISLSDQPLLTLENFQLDRLQWEYRKNKVTVASNDPRVRFVESAMTVTLHYLQEAQIAWQPFFLSIKSELDDASGKKYGLGSSAAVSVSVITAILQQFMQKKPDAELVFRLSAISHAKTQGNGSGADVAASAFGGIIAYSSFQAYWLKDAYQQAPDLLTLLKMDWPYLSIQPVALPENIHVCIGWTGSPASTAKLVDEVLQLKEDNPPAFSRFLKESEIAVSQFMDGLQRENPQTLIDSVKLNRKALHTVGEAANVPIQTPELAKLCDLAEYYGGAGKPSGAGGGDCGIAFMPTAESAAQLRIAWEKAGIKALDLHVSSTGAAVIK
ncbi:phosphomevalonate kinase [Tigheibacillus jepli]|uniref:phosphomevalonate kinase n=1 Tax=Tigheibacillus jepli TaxID=3035914 RepID=UPI00387E0AC8